MGQLIFCGLFINKGFVLISPQLLKIDLIMFSNAVIFSPLEQFEIFPLLYIQFSFVDISFTNSTLLLFISIFIVVFVFQLLVVWGGGFLVPNCWQVVFESFYVAVMGMVNESIGSKGAQYFPFVFTLFSFLLSCNLMGLVPYSFTVTSHLIVTLTVSTIIWVGKLLVGLRYHGIQLLGMFLPSGAPFAIVPFLVFIELIGFFITVISLSVRLFANIMAGHILLKVLAGFAWVMLVSGGFLFVAHFVPLGVLFLLLGLETGVAFVQAYVFTLLTCLYISDMISGGHLFCLFKVFLSLVT